MIPSIDLTTSTTLVPDYTVKTTPSKPIAKTTPSKPIAKTPPSKPIVTTTPFKPLDACDSQKNNEESVGSCEEKTVGLTQIKCNYQSGKSPNSDEALPHNLPFPERLSIKVEAAISNRSVVSERTQLIADVSTFYYGLSRHPRQGDYKRIAILVCERFPELRDSNPSNYWVSYSAYLCRT
jgi:hypothetical protein